MSDNEWKITGPDGKEYAVICSMENDTPRIMSGTPFNIIQGGTLVCLYPKPAKDGECPTPERYRRLARLSVILDDLHRVERGLLSFGPDEQLDGLRHLRTAQRRLQEVMNLMRGEE